MKKMKHGAIHHIWQPWLGSWLVRQLTTLMGSWLNKDFRRRFWMRCHVFECVLHDVQHVNPCFQQKLDRAGRPGFSPHQKVTIALRMLVYAFPADAIDDTYGMSESSCLDTLVEFCQIVVQLYKEKYLSQPNQADLKWLLRKAEECGFPGVIGSLDCMHWQWNNCPTG